MSDVKQRCVRVGCGKKGLLKAVGTEEGVTERAVEESQEVK